MAIVIGGSTADAWVQSATSQGITLTLTADPAGEGAHVYAPGSGDDPVFDAKDRDDLVTDGPFGIGVLNQTIHYGDAGVTSIPSEVGYYGNDELQLGTDRADVLDVSFGKDMRGGSVDASFFYAGEADAAEQLKYELWNDGQLVFSEVVTSAGNGTYSGVNAGNFTFNLATGITFDEIKFVGFDAQVADATDFLIERITTDDVDCFGGLSQGYWKGHSNLWDGTAKYDSTFAVDAFGTANKTLSEAIGLNGGGEAALARQAVAAFENANGGLQDSYRFSATEIKDAMKQAYDGATDNIFNTTKGAHLQNVLEFWNTVPEKQPGGDLCSDDGTVVANTLVSVSLKGGSFDGSLLQVLHDLYVNDGWIV